MSFVITETEASHILRLHSQTAQLSTNESEDSPLPVHEHVQNLIDQMVATQLFSPKTLSEWYGYFFKYLQKAKEHPNDQSSRIVAFSICHLITTVLVPTLDAWEEHPQNKESIDKFIDAFIHTMQQFLPVDSKDFALRFLTHYFHMLKMELAEACAFDIERYACEMGNQNLQLIQDKFKQIKQRVISICKNNESLRQQFQSNLNILSEKIEQIESRLTACSDTIEGLADQMHSLHVREKIVLEKLKADN